MNLFYDLWYMKKKEELHKELFLTQKKLKYSFRFHGFFDNFTPIEGFDENRDYYYFDKIVVFLYTDNDFNEVINRIFVPYYDAELVRNGKIPDYLIYEINKLISKLPLKKFSKQK